MKKNRNSFFSEYGYNMYNINPNIDKNYLNQPIGYQMPDINSRINKLEHDIKTLEERINILENKNNNQNVEVQNDYNFASSMYMI